MLLLYECSYYASNGFDYNDLPVFKDTLSDPNSLCKLHKTTGTMTWVTISAEETTIYNIKIISC